MEDRQNCLFCFKRLDINAIISRGIRKEGVVYQSCCRLINKDDLGEDFFNWNQRTPLPFCDECLSWAQKIALLNAKLEAIEEKIGKCVKKFTKIFVQERETNIASKDDDSPIEYPLNSTRADSSFPIYDSQKISITTYKGLLNKAEEESDDPDEGCQNEGDELENIVVKREFNDFADHQEESANDFDSFLSCENDYIDLKPNIEKINVEIPSRSSTKRQKVSKKARAPSDRSYKRKLRNDCRYLEGNKITSRNVLPHRTAALKAVKSFLSQKYQSDEEVEDDTQSNKSEESIVKSDSGSEVDERGRDCRKSRSKDKKKNCLKCNYCHIEFAKKSELKNHLLTHSGERPFQCSKCSLRFTTEKFLAIHSWKHFSEKFFKCGHCENAYKYMHCLKDHVKNQKHHINEKDKCEVCDEAIAEGKELLQQHKVESGFLPPSDAGKLQKSPIKRNIETPFGCDKCSFSFTTEKLLQIHSWKHFNDKFFQCGHCENSYKYLHSLKDHIKTQKYHDHWSDPCDLCEANIAKGNQLLKEKKIERGYTPASNKSNPLPKKYVQKNADRPFGCEKCSLRFISEKFLKIHSWKHFSEKIFKCGHCDNKYKYLHSLKDHLKHQGYHKDGKDEPCPLCDEAIDNGKQSLLQKKVECGFLPANAVADIKEKKIRAKTEERPFGCDKCSLRFTTEKFLQIHSWKHFSEKFFKCAHCDNTYKYMHCLKDHVKNQGHHKGADVDDIACFLCEEAIKVGKEQLNQKKIENGFIPSQYGNNSNILKEIRKKYKVKEPKEVIRKKRPKIVYMCTECGKTLPGKSELFYHRYTHQPSGTELKCEDCDEAFANAISHQKHALEAHPKSEAESSKKSMVTQCPICGKLLKGNLNSHMYLHSDVKQFACPTCDKRFSTKRLMKVHTVIHSKDRPFLCEECGQGFYTSSKLKEHYRIHSGLLLFCEFCPKGFRNSTHLKQHLRSHNRVGKRPSSTTTESTPPLLLQCSYCGQYFENEQQLAVHMAAHNHSNY